MALLCDYADILQEHLSSDTLKIHKYHGPNKEIDQARLSQFDIVLTTYATCEYDSDRGRRFFQDVKFYRIVLDEGKKSAVLHCND